MAVNVTEFIRSIGQQPPPKIILFTAGKPPFGKEDFEPYLADEAIERMIAAYVDPGMHDLALTIAYADETEPGQVAEEVRTMPFLVERRVVLVRNANVYAAMNTEKRSPMLPLIECLESPPDSTILMMISPTADKRKRFFKACEANGVIVECPQLDDRALATWIRGKVSERNMSISAGAVAVLIERVGGRLSDMLNAINLVCNYAAGRSQIADDDVQAACADVAEATVWALTDAIAQSNTGDALEALNDLLAMNKSPDEIMGTINWLLETAYRAHPDTQLAPPKPFVMGKVGPLAKKFSLPRLKNALALSTRTLFALRDKGSSQAALLLEVFIVKLAATRH